jgi:hypothetical protein
MPEMVAWMGEQFARVEHERATHGGRVDRNQRNVQEAQPPARLEEKKET